MWRTTLLVVSALTVFTADAPMRAADLPPDLALVPADAAGFVHVRVGDAVRSENLKEVRELVKRAGPKALETFSKRFTPDPFSFDRVTVYLLPPAPGGRPEPEPVVIFRTSKPFDPAAVAKALLPGAEATTVGGARFVRDERKDVALRVVDNQTFLICPVTTAARTGAAPNRTGPLAPALAQAAGGKVLVAAINASVLPRQALAEVPPPLKPLAEAKLATLMVELAAEPKVELRLSFADGDAASAAEQTVRGLVKMGMGAIDMGRGELERRLAGTGQPGTIEELPEAAASLLGLGAMSQAEQFLKDLPLRRDGADLSVAVKVPAGLQGNLAVGGAVLPALLLPAVQKVRDAAGRQKSQNNLKQIALAFHNYHDAMGAMPAHATYSRDGKPLLSWRVAILPYLEQDNLYRQFKLDEPWDSDHNKKLIPIMPPIYRAAGVPPTEPGMTHYRVFVGPGAAFQRAARGPRIAQITDGTSNTLLAVESNDPVIWTKPDDAEFAADKPLPKLTPIYPGGINVAFMDGSVRLLKSTLAENVWRLLIQPADGQVIPNLDQ